MEVFNDIFKFVFRPGTFVVAIAVWVIVFFMRRIAELLAPSLKKKAGELERKAMYGSWKALWWNEVVLYALPVFVGACFGLMKSDLINSQLDTRGAAIVFDGTIGWFSGFLYKLLKKAIQTKTGISIDVESVAPPPIGGTVVKQVMTTETTETIETAETPPGPP